MKRRRSRPPRGPIPCSRCGRTIVLLRTQPRRRMIGVNPTGVMIDIDGPATAIGYVASGEEVRGEIVQARDSGLGTRGSPDASRVPLHESRPRRLFKVWLEHRCDPLNRMAHAARIAAQAGG